MIDLSKHFERLFSGIAVSKVYRDVVRHAMADIPDWVLPFSIIDMDDLATVVDNLKVGPGKQFVDLGCGLGGPGLWVARKTGAALVGVDFSRSAVNAASSTARTQTIASTFTVADAVDTGLPAGRYDALMSIDVIQFADPHRVVREIARLLRPGARSVIRTWESMTDGVPLPTLVKAYQPIFSANGLVVREHRIVNAPREREHAFHSEMVRRADDLRSEIGDIAESLIEESRDSVAREHDEPRVKRVWIIAEKRARARLSSRAT